MLAIPRWSDVFARHQSGALQPYEPALDFLYRDVVESGRKVVVEYGSGCSTVALSMACHVVGGKVWSFETDPRWARVTRRYLDHPAFVNVEIVEGVAVEEFVGGWPAWRHDDIAVVPDLVFMDGPQLDMAHPFVSDPLYLEVRMRPGARVVFDKRLSSALFFEHFAKRDWERSVHGEARFIVYDLQG